MERPIMRKYLVLMLMIPGLVIAQAQKVGIETLFKKPTDLLEEIATALISFGLPFFTVAAVLSAYLMYSQRMSKHWFFSSAAGAFILLMARYVMQFFFGYFQ